MTHSLRPVYLLTGKQRGEGVIICHTPHPKIAFITSKRFRLSLKSNPLFWLGRWVPWSEELPFCSAMIIRMGLVCTLYQGYKTQLQAKDLSGQWGRFPCRVTAQTPRCTVVYFIYFFLCAPLPLPLGQWGRCSGVDSRNWLDQLLSPFQ